MATAEELVREVRNAANKRVYPLYVLPVENVDKLDVLIPHEEALKAGLLVELQDAPNIGSFFAHKVLADGTSGERLYKGKTFFTDNLLVFSHRWLRPSLDPSKSHPDSKDGIKMKGIRQVIDMQKEIWVDMKKSETPQFIWMDYFSVPQFDFDKQRQALLSIPAYFRSSSKFVALMRNEADFVKYMSRCWCRLEVVTARSPHRFKSLFYIPKQQYYFYMENKEIHEFGWEHFQNPLDGDLTDERDRVYIGGLLKYYSVELERFKGLPEAAVYYQQGQDDFIAPKDVPQDVVANLKKFAS
mmetsp:Transcript_25496/g.31325  ORF Transcript_25496/g.31325 Transcript_25496/m.31325 type:complete len:299 (-) Transcript_25496:1486-2382(-)